MNQPVSFNALPANATFSFGDMPHEMVVYVGNRREPYIYPINITNLTLRRHIPKDLFLIDEEMLRIIYSMYRYTIRVGDSKDWKKYKFIPNALVGGIRNSLLCSSDLLRFKVATIVCTMKRFVPTKDVVRIQSVFMDHGLTRDDALLYCFLCHNGELEKFIKLLSSVPEPFVASLDAFRIELESEKLQKQLYSFSKYHAGRKLTFVYKGHRFTHEDMTHELAIAGAQAYYWVRPFFSKKHAINYASAAVEKQTHHVIKYYTDPCRARIIQDGDGYTNTTVSFSAETTGSWLSDSFCEDDMLTYIDNRIHNVIAA